MLETLPHIEIPDELPEFEQDSVETDHQSPENLDGRINSTVKFCQNYIQDIYNDQMNQIEFMNLRRITKEVYRKAYIEKTNDVMIEAEIMRNYWSDMFNINIASALQVSGNDWDTFKKYIRGLREKNNEF